MPILAYTTLALVFVLDAITPQTLCVEIAYEGSVVIAARNGNRGLIARVLSVTLLSNVLGGVLQAGAEGVNLIARGLARFNAGTTCERADARISFAIRIARARRRAEDALKRASHDIQARLRERAGGRAL